MNPKETFQRMQHLQRAIRPAQPAGSNRGSTHAASKISIPSTA